MEYLDCYAEVGSGFDQEQQSDQVSFNNFTDDHSEINNNSSDYYNLTNITRSVLMLKMMPFLCQILKIFLMAMPKQKIIALPQKMRNKRMIFHKPI